MYHSFFSDNLRRISILTTELSTARLWEIQRFMSGTHGHWLTEFLDLGKVGEVSHSDGGGGEPREAAPPRREPQDSPQHGGREYLKRAKVQTLRLG